MRRKMKLTSIVLFISFFGILNSQIMENNYSYTDYIKDNIPDTEEIDVFLNESGWVKFDPITGYILDSCLRHDGIDNSYTMVTSQANGARTSLMYNDLPCRINTYGDSFTQASQVSNGETWQEYLAAHLGEPIRNYGVGGLGVYQAYRRMLREESTESRAEYNILYIWGDDHIRSLLRCRYMLIKDWHVSHYKTSGKGKVFHGNFWANIEMNLKTGEFKENNSLIQDSDDMHKMTDADWMVDNLQDDLALQMYLFKLHKINKIDVKPLKKLSKCLGLDIDLDNKSTLHQNVTLLLDEYGFAATKYIIDRSNEYAQANDKKLMIILFDPYKVTKTLIDGGVRFDQTIVDYLEEEEMCYFDMNVVHAEDYKSFNISVEDYFDRYFIGHYNPAGNHFFAYSIKDMIVEWLNPKPITYRGVSNEGVDFGDYLEGVSSDK